VDAGSARARTSLLHRHAAVRAPDVYVGGLDLGHLGREWRAAGRTGRRWPEWTKQRHSAGR
jgi:hypothetical protein